jgi:glutaredoxin-like YruB-family protein
MEKVISYSDLLSKISNNDKTFLLLYKSNGELSECAYKNLQSAMAGVNNIPVLATDVAMVRDIHTQYNITSVPSLLVFEKTNLTGVIKGCHDVDFYKALTENAIYQAKAKAEGKTAKNVTVYSTPTCSWCNTLKAWLRKNNIPFTDVDVSRDPQAAEDLVRRTGQQGVPQTDINGQFVIGFDQNKLKQLLEI